MLLKLYNSNIMHQIKHLVNYTEVLKIILIIYLSHTLSIFPAFMDGGDIRYHSVLYFRYVRVPK